MWGEGREREGASDEGSDRRIVDVEGGVVEEWEGGGNGKVDGSHVTWWRE